MFYNVSIVGEFFELFDNQGSRSGKGDWGSLMAVPLFMLGMNSFAFVMVYGTIFLRYFDLM